LDHEYKNEARKHNHDIFKRREEISHSFTLENKEHNELVQLTDVCATCKVSSVQAWLQPYEYKERKKVIHFRLIAFTVWNESRFFRLW